LDKIISFYPNDDKALFEKAYLLSAIAFDAYMFLIDTMDNERKKFIAKDNWDKQRVIQCLEKSIELFNQGLALNNPCWVRNTIDRSIGSARYPTWDIVEEVVNLKKAIKRLREFDEKAQEEEPEPVEDIKDARTTEELVSALENSDFFVRRNAALVLGKRGDARAIDVLATELEESKPKHRIEMLRVLGKLGGKRALDALLAAAFHDFDNDVRRSAIRVLGKIDDARARQALTDLTKDSKEYIRKIANETLAKTQDAHHANTQ
jgi:hypothetical protein